MSGLNAYDKLLKADATLGEVRSHLAAGLRIVINNTAEFRCEHSSSLQSTGAEHLRRAINDCMDELKRRAIELAQLDRDAALEECQQEIGPVCEMVPREMEQEVDAGR